MNVNKTVGQILKEPLLRELRPGSLEFFARQREIIRSKALLHRSYLQFYDLFVQELAAATGGSILFELGSGGGFLKELLPSVITSDITPGVADLVMDAQRLPFRDASVRAVFMASVFHHIPDARQFFREVNRVLAPGGIVSMVEPAWTPMGRFFYTHVHHERSDPGAPDWAFSQQDAMIDANVPLAWMVFSRDRRKFEKEFPALRITRVSFLPWLPYLVSGGVNYRQIIPNCINPVAILCDQLLKPLRPVLSLTWYIGLRKVAP